MQPAIQPETDSSTAAPAAIQPPSSCSTRQHLVDTDTEGEYRLLFMANPTPMFVFDEETFQFLAVNDAAIACYGWSRSEFLAMSVLEIRPIEERILARQTILDNNDAHNTKIGVFRHCRKDGSIMEMEISVSSITFSGRPARLCLMNDITERNRAETALRTSEERFHNTLETILEGCQIIDHDWRYLFVNPAAARHGRCRPQDLVGKTMMDVYPGIERTSMFEKLRICMNTRIPQQLDNEFSYSDGRRAWFRLDIQPVPEGIFVLSMDITARKREEEERDRTVKLLHIVNTSRGLKDLVAKSVVFFREHSGFEAAGIRLKQGDDFPYFETLGFPEHFLESETNLHCPSPEAASAEVSGGKVIPECLCSRIINGTMVPETGHVTGQGNFWCNDLPAGETASCARNNCNREGYRSVGLYALRADGICIGLLQLSDRRRNMFIDDTAMLWERLAGYLSIAIAKSVAREELTRSRQEWVNTVNSIPDLISIIDNRHRIVRVNKAMADKLGIPQEAAQGLHCYNSVHGTDVPVAACPHVQCLQDNREHVAEIYEKNLGGEFLVSVTPITDVNGSVCGCVHVARDITELKKRERELNKLNRVLTALGKSTYAMSRTTDEKIYLDEVCRIIVEDCNHAMVWIGFAENDPQKSVRVAASAGFEAGYLDALNITWADTERGRGPTGTAIRTGKMTMCRNMRTDPRFAPWRTLASGQGYMSSIVFPLRDGSHIFGALNIYSREPDPFSGDEVNLLSDLANDLAHGIIVMRESIGRRKAEAELARSEERYRSLFSAMTDGFALLEVIIDESGSPADYRFLEINQAFERLTGFDKKAILGKTAKEVLPGNSNALTELFGEVALTGKPVHSEFYAPLHSRQYEIFTYRPASGQCAVLFRDVTDRKVMEDQLASHTRELSAANKELEAFAYSVSHDLRAPLRAIYSFSGMLGEECAAQLDEQGREYLSRISAGARKMNSLIDDIMNLSQISRHAIITENIDMSSIAVQILAELRQAQPQRRAICTVMPGMQVRADRRLLEIALTNLLQNAWKYSGKRDETLITFGCEMIDGEQTFHISDNGAGFDMKHAGRLFAPFTRLHRERDFPGTGIGLAIVNRVIARHGGRIWAEGVPDAGACFRFTLPEGTETSDMREVPAC